MVVFFFYGCEETPQVQIITPENGIIDTSTSEVTIIGKITPPRSSLSIAYSGECGTSYLRDIPLNDDVFVHTFAIHGVKRIELFLVSPQSKTASYSLVLKNAPLDKTGECRYLNVRKTDWDAPRAYMVEKSCYEIGYEYGSFLFQQKVGLSHPHESTVSIPFRCRDDAQTKKGIDASGF